MDTHADKGRETKSESATSAEAAYEDSGSGLLVFPDLRPSQLSQREVQQMANNSPQVRQLRAFETLANQNLSPGKRPAQFKIGANAKVGSPVIKTGKPEKTFSIKKANPPGHKGKQNWSYRLNPGGIFVKGNDDTYSLASGGGGASKKEETISLFHLTTAPKWAAWLAKLKSEKAAFDAQKPINPNITKDKRTADEPMGDGRGGDDLGPGFYTADSAEFIKEYHRLNPTPDEDTGVIEFVIPKSIVDGLKVKQIAPDDVDTFQQYMRDGFLTFDTQKQLLHLPKLDTEAPAFDLISGPINDAESMQGVPAKTTGGVQHSHGKILEMGGNTPMQWNWATETGVAALYEGAEKIEYTPWQAWEQSSKK